MTDLRARLKALETRLGVGQAQSHPPADGTSAISQYQDDPDDRVHAHDDGDSFEQPRFRPKPISEQPRVRPTPVEPLGARLQRYALAQRDRPARKRIPDPELARMLGGRLCADGVVLVEHVLPSASRHGGVRFAEIHDIALDFIAGGTEPLRDALLFIDTETTGLAGGTGTIAFLLGLARVRGDTVEVRQYFLTCFAGEAAMLMHALEWITPASHLVSFNGKTFDLPLLVTRYQLSRVTHPLAELSHLDLLHRTRAAFRKNWPDCRLQTAERHLLKLFRDDDDIPGHLIPQIWTDLLQHGETRHLRGVVAHNRSDILSLIGLACVLGRTYAEPGHPDADPLGIARAHRRTGDTATALRHLQAHDGSLPDDARLELAALYARAGDFDKAVPEWTKLADRNILLAMERLAVYHEHHKRDYSSALLWTEKMRPLCPNHGDIERRRTRLVRKSARSAPLVSSQTAPPTVSSIAPLPV